MDRFNVCPASCFSVDRWLELKRNSNPKPLFSGQRAACSVRYSDPMFDVLVYLYETYWRPDACPDQAQLRRKLSAIGFNA